MEPAASLSAVSGGMDRNEEQVLIFFFPVGELHVNFTFAGRDNLLMSSRL